MPLGLSPRETTIAEDQFRNAPSAVVPEATGGEIAMENISAPFNAALGGVAGTYAAVRSLGSNFGALGGYDPETSSVVEQEPEAVQRKFALDSAAIANQYAPDPRKSGAGAQFVYNIGSGAVKMVGDTLITGNPVSGAAMFGATEGINTRNEIYAATGDKETADKLAIGSALFSGIAALMPGGYGNTFAARIASGAVANTTFGVLQRDMMHTGLQDAGYTDMAKQYVPLDGAAMMADGILGTVFGGVHHMFAPEITDSARAIKDAEHAERSSPGIPSDPVSRQNGLDNLDRTISSMIHGDDPPPVGDVNFVPDPKQDATREAAMTEVTVLKEEAIGKQEEVPIEAFHGTRADFDQYQMGRGDVGLGPHFGTIEQANQVAQGEGGNVRPVALQFKNTLRLRDGMWEVPSSVIRMLKDFGVISESEATSLADSSGERFGTDEGAMKKQFAAIRQTLIDKGYDSIVYKNVAEGVSGHPLDKPLPDVDSYIALKPDEQVKGKFTSSKLGRTARAAEAEKEQKSQLDPETQEAVLQAHAAIKDNPDLQVAGEDGKPVSAVDELNKSLDTLKQDDGELAKVALACAGRA